jgi:hypothetical protein
MGLEAYAGMLHPERAVADRAVSDNLKGCASHAAASLPRENPVTPFALKQPLAPCFLPALKHHILILRRDSVANVGYPRAP